MLRRLLNTKRYSAVGVVPEAATPTKLRRVSPR